jgi:hypothetical protein
VQLSDSIGGDEEDELALFEGADFNGLINAVRSVLDNPHVSRIGDSKNSQIPRCTRFEIC